MRTVLCEKRI
jgi:hypothetical protein